MSAEEELLALSRKLLTSIDAGDWAGYTALCDESITCFEPEAPGQLVRGLPFHKFYFEPEFKGGNTGTALVASKPAESLMIKAVH